MYKMTNYETEIYLHEEGHVDLSDMNTTDYEQALDFIRNALERYDAVDNVKITISLDKPEGE